MKTKPLSGELWGEALWNARKCHKCEKEKDRKYIKKSINRDSIICFKNNLLVLKNDTAKHYHLSVFQKKVPPFSKIILAQTKWSKPYHLSMLHKTLSEVFSEKNCSCSIWIRQVLTKHVRKLCSRFSILCNHCPNNSSVCYHPFPSLSFALITCKNNQRL